VQTGDQGAETINLDDKINYIYGIYVHNYGATHPLTQSGKFIIWLYHYISVSQSYIICATPSYIFNNLSAP